MGYTDKGILHGSIYGFNGEIVGPQWDKMGYLDLLYGAYFCRCSKTVELSPFLRKNAVPENKCRCEKLSAHVVGYFRRLVGYFRRLVGHFRR